MEQKQDTRLTIKFKLTCKCGNDNIGKFIINKGLNCIELLCVICEKKYEVKLTSEEIKLWQKH